MIASTKLRRARSGGVALMLCLIFIAIFASLAAAFFSATSMNLVAASNTRAMLDSRLAAESGLAFLTYKMEHCGVSGSLRGQALLNGLAAKLKADMNGSDNLGGALITSTTTTITIPQIAIDGGKSFTAQITLPAYDTLRLTVVGEAGSGGGASATAVRRQVAIDLRPQWEAALGFGLCSIGSVQMGMNADFSGVSQGSDGSIYSGTPGLAVTCGSGHISGDVIVSTPGATTSLGGTTIDGSIIYNAPPVALPTIDRAPYTLLATTTMNSPAPASGTYKNIRIPANTNPTFGDVTLQGVIYIEAPNKVSFSNNCSFTGVIVAADPPPDSPDSDNYISFQNSMTFSGPENLPDTPEFAEVRKFKGASILCPGFTMECKNNMTSIGGIMALKSLIAKNNLHSTVYGSLLIYGEAGLDFKNNPDMNISLSGAGPPPGFVGYGLAPLLPDSTTYVEH